MREQFPIFRHHPELIYLDSAATAHKPDCVIAAMTKFYEEDYATVHRAAYRGSLKATEQYNAARETVRRFLNAALADEVIFTRGTTEAINFVARSFPFEKGDEVIVSAHAHHSNLVPWQMLAQERGVVLKWLPPGSSLLPLSKRTKLVAATHCSNVTGEIAPIASFVEQAKSVGAAVLVDGAQAAPHLAIDVQALGVDFYAFSGHKCYGPTGIGVLYGKMSQLLRLKPLQGGGDMVARVDLEESSYQAPPLCFEAGTPNIAGVLGLKAALEFLESAERDEMPLLHLARSRLQEIEGVRILGNPEAPLLTFVIEGVHPLDLAALLDSRNIAIRTGNLCAQPLLRSFGCEIAARASFGLYNTLEEVEVFTNCVEETVKKLTKS